MHYVLQVKSEWTKTIMIYRWKKVIRLCSRVASLCPKALNDRYSGLQRVCEALSRWCGAGPDRKIAHTRGSASHITNVDDGKLSFLVYPFYHIHQLCNTWVDLKMRYVCLSNKMTQWNSRCGIGFVNGVAVIGYKTGHSLQRDPHPGWFSWIMKPASSLHTALETTLAFILQFILRTQIGPQIAVISVVLI